MSKKEFTSVHVFGIPEEEFEHDERWCYELSDPELEVEVVYHSDVTRISPYWHFMCLDCGACTMHSEYQN